MPLTARIPPLHALMAFECAARLGGFAPAAQELSITAGAVGHRIRLLEGRIGTPLFERSASGVRLNEAGVRYLAKVRDALDKLALLADGGEPRPSTIRVGSPPTFVRNLLIPRLPVFHRAWPDVEIDVAITGPTQARPERHDVDIRFGPGGFDDRRATKLFDDTMVVLGAPALLAARGVAAPADLERVELLRSPLVSWQPWLVAAGLDWPEPRRGAVFADLGLLLEAAAAGLGVALGPRRIAERWLAEGALVQPFDVGVPASSAYFALVDAEQAARPEVTAFIGWLHDALG